MLKCPHCGSKDGFETVDSGYIFKSQVCSHPTNERVLRCNACQQKFYKRMIPVVKYNTEIYPAKPANWGSK